MASINSQPRGLVPNGRRAYVEGLLARYPDVTRDEAADILHFIKKGSFLEVGLMSGDERLAPQIERFRADHADSFSLGVRDWASVALIVAGLLIVCALLWNAGAS